MAQLQYGDRFYETMLGSTENGWFVELIDTTGIPEGILSAFRADADRSITFAGKFKDLPFEIVEAFIQRVRSELVGEFVARPSDE
jgi:hypothetical protein